MNLNLFFRHPILGSCSPKEAVKLLEVSPLHQSPVYLCKDDKLYQYYLLLCPYRLFVTTNPADAKPVSYVPVEFCKLVTKFGVVLDSQVVNMISLRSDKIETNIFFENQETAEMWVRVLRPFTVSDNFEQEFILQDKLGTGNFSSVFRCREITTGLLFAAKRFPKDRLLSDELELESLRNEVKLLGSTDHPNCIKLLGVFETKNHLFVLSNLFTGSDLLFRVLLEDRLQVLAALKICQQLLSILAHLESKQIIHRDVKPMNLLFKDTCEDSEICLVDFGFATAICDSKKLFSQCGTAGYVAPEVLRGEDYDCRADVFSAGVVLHFTVTGELPTVPFSPERFVEKYQDVLFPPLICSTFDSELRSSKPRSPDFISLLDSMLAPDPEARPAAGQAAKHPAFQAIEKPTKRDQREAEELSTMAETTVSANEVEAKPRKDSINSALLKPISYSHQQRANKKGSFDEDETHKNIVVSKPRGLSMFNQPSRLSDNI